MFVLLLSLPVVLSAEEVSEQEAAVVARQFLSQRGRQIGAQRPLRIAVRGRRAPMASATHENSPYYIFNVSGNDGFVVVSGDDRTPAILGYADEGAIAEASMPEALQALLDGYAEQIAWLDEHPQMRLAAQTTARSSIEPLIQTQWNQGTPYNNLCPTRTVGKTTQRTVTGCVATSMAQIMYYHQHPTSTTTTIPSYTTRTTKIEMDELDATTFDWNSMVLNYSGTTSDDAQTAVATLMLYCGTALQMDYNISSAGGSSAYNVSIAEALKRYFGYDNGAEYVLRSWYSYEDWINLLYNELAARRPVILGGQSTGGGHSFVCDGYESNDYFHINWGWGGSSDGFFRLSALSPYEQGIGGSSSLDGFSYTQEAIIGLQPAQDEASPLMRLSLEDFQFGSGDSDATKIFERTSTEEAFTDIPLYLTLWHYQFDTQTYDYALQLTDANGTVVETEVLGESQAFTTFNQPLKVTTSECSLGAGLADGTYYLKVVCRTTDSDDYYDCYGTTPFQMTAVISNNQLTLTAPIVKCAYPTLNSITVDGNLTKGYEQEVLVELTGGSADFRQNLFLYVNDTKVMGRQADIPAGETVTVHFYYTPSTEGTNTLKIMAVSTSLGTETVTIASSDATSELTLSSEATIENQNADGALYADALRLSLTMTNPSSEYSYVGQINCSLRTWVQEADESWTFTGNVQRQTVTIDKNSSTVVNFAFDGLERGAYYSARVTYKNAAQSSGLLDAVHVGYDGTHGSLQTADGYFLGMADGITTPYPATTSIDAGTAAFVDLRPMSDVSEVDITTSSNPNCLYLLTSSASVPSGLSGCNVVSGTTAASISLTDGYDFYTPISFTATNIDYVRTFTLPAAGTSGWNTLYLPFTVSSVTVDDGSVDGKTIDWFHSDSDTGKNFWLKTLTGDAEGTVYFDHADAINAYTPYIIAVPGDTWGDEWQLTGKAITFAGTNASITTSTSTALSGDNYNFYGTTLAQALSDAYVLDDTGSTFFLQTEPSVSAFRAWFEDAQISSLNMPALTIATQPANGIGAVIPVQGKNDVHDLQGRRLGTSDLRLLPKGIYIVGGRKYLIP
ncbi:MAG: C10 family peptidase [Bacteroidales bacterium]|nr:C10 family peptidase [Bacteroidales bacterium]